MQLPSAKTHVLSLNRSRLTTYNVALGLTAAVFLDSGDYQLIVLLLSTFCITARFFHSLEAFLVSIIMTGHALSAAYFSIDFELVRLDFLVAG